MSPHDEELFDLWQKGRRAGIPPQDRLPPVNDNRSTDELDRDLAAIRECLERKS